MCKFFLCGATGAQQKPYAWANREIDTLYAWVNRNPDKMMIVKTPDDLMKALKEHKLATMMGVEGGHMIENDLSKLDSLFKRGVRYMTLHGITLLHGQHRQWKRHMIHCYISLKV